MALQLNETIRKEQTYLTDCEIKVIYHFDFTINLCMIHGDI